MCASGVLGVPRCLEPPGSAPARAAPAPSWGAPGGYEQLGRHVRTEQVGPPLQGRLRGQLRRGGRGGGVTRTRGA
jgi:hypothetical protein